MRRGLRPTTASASPGNEMVALLFHRLPPPRILNLGAGSTGHAAEGKYVVNVDHAPPSSLGAGAFVLADASQLPFEDGAFSGALLKDVIEHTLDAIAVLSEVRRVTASGGALVLTTPRPLPRAVWDDPTHIRGFTAHALVQALTLSGWTPSGSPRRIGALPGAGRLGLVPWLERIMRIPLLGHWFGTNWIVHANAI